MKHLVDMALSLVLPQFRLDVNHGWHGIAHWSRVWRNGKELCEAMGEDPTVPCLFAFLHDSQRFDEGRDYEHGHRAAEWIGKLFYDNKLSIKASDYSSLVTAIAGHSDGETEESPIVQICWDSDRLDLGRVGIMPDPLRLCTEHAKKEDTIQRAWARSIGQPQRTIGEMIL
jgi:uncharacterized protein